MEPRVADAQCLKNAHLCKQGAGVACKDANVNTVELPSTEARIHQAEHPEMSGVVTLSHWAQPSRVKK